MNSEFKRILILGGGPSNIGHEGEQDAAAYQAIAVWEQLGIDCYVIDDNAYSLLLTELPVKQRIIANPTTESVTRVLKEQRIDAITPIFGQKNALKIVQRLARKGVLAELNVKLVGLHKNNLALFGTETANQQANTVIAERLINNQIPVVSSTFVSNFSELRATLTKLNFPIAIKAVDAPKNLQHRHVFQNMEELNNNVEDLFQQSPVHQLTLAQSVGDYQEVGIVAVRDRHGNKLIVSSLEDLNPIKVNATDSVIFVPAQTLTANQIQQLRALTFRLLDCLGIEGVCHIQFAIEQTTKTPYVFKVNPFFNSATALVTHASGYPLAMVVANILANQDLDVMQLPATYHRLTPLLQPVYDHITVKIPIWSFDYLTMANPELGGRAKATGAAMGIGSNFEAAFMHALRSSQPSPKDVLPSYSELSEDEIIQQLLHPTDKQLLILYEAINRGYSLPDLSELTKINPALFEIMKNILNVIQFVRKNQLRPEALAEGNRYGFGNGMFCNFWNTSNESVQNLQEELPSPKTYKMIEPTAGELSERLPAFYSTYGLNSEVSQLSSNSALIIGKGRNHLGPNTASDTYTAEMLIQLRKLGIKTIILNNNPNSVSLISELSDRQYVEPIQLGEIQAIIAIEKPAYVFLPGNRHYLIRALQKMKHSFKLIIIPPDQNTGEWQVPDGEVGVDLLVTKADVVPIATVGFRCRTDCNKHGLEEQTDYYVPAQTPELAQLTNTAVAAVQKTKLTGLIQVVFHKNSANNYKLSGITPLRITETIFLNHATGVNWIRLLMQMYTSHFDISYVSQIINSDQFKLHPLKMQVVFPFRELGISKDLQRRNFEIGAWLAVDNETETF
ncbi:Carbamoyl-phosphate synthase large chain [Fructilactobacillus florum 8D]|uniref:Carbamoyl-phosphate synthase large chain n=1 Tax=Fructilactobacillus florum 8D TaxID=1221538 RepID=W9EF01_9LACO|nr:ATP-grasp domain-containing protein [Fructilactobacillus florum]ETO40657.1 Carbamoyl-phosphate synthase large chain [Fructilactobacillus florum 8D]